jgi:general secretion pathway protein I
MRQRGFSLLEILVAFSVLALSLGILMQIFMGATRNADLAKNQLRATTLAQSLLAGVDAEPLLSPAESSGAESDGFRWRIQIAPFEGTGGDGVAIPQSMAVLWQVSVRVAWDGNPHEPERTLALVTLRARPGQ